MGDIADLERSGVDRRAAGVRLGAVENERSGSGHGEAADAVDIVRPGRRHAAGIHRPVKGELRRSAYRLAGIDDAPAIDAGIERAAFVVRGGQHVLHELLRREVGKGLLDEREHARDDGRRHRGARQRGIGSSRIRRINVDPGRRDAESGGCAANVGELGDRAGCVHGGDRDPLRLKVGKEKRKPRRRKRFVFLTVARGENFDQPRRGARAPRGDRRTEDRQSLVGRQAEYPAPAVVDDPDAFAGHERERRRQVRIDRVVCRRAMLIEDPPGHDVGIEGDALHAHAVARRGDDAGDMGAVTVGVGQDRRVGHVVVAADDAALEFRMRRIDAAVQHADGDAGAGIAFRIGDIGVDLRQCAGCVIFRRVEVAGR